MLMGLLMAAPLASALNVTITPEQPQTGEEITAHLPAPSGAVNATVQVCIGDKCFVPAEMEKYSRETKDCDNCSHIFFLHTFYINESGEAHLNIMIEYENGSRTWDNTTAFKVEGADGGNGTNGTPGFGLAAVMAAVVAIAVLQRRTKS